MNDNEEDEDGYEELTEEEISEMFNTSAHLGTCIERELTLVWLRQTAAQFLFADNINPKVREYGTTVLEMVADAIAEKEHWAFLYPKKETIQ